MLVVCFIYCETNIDFWMQECINRVVALEQMGKAVGLHVSRPASYFLKFWRKVVMLTCLHSSMTLLWLLSACIQVEFLELWMIEGNLYISLGRRWRRWLIILSALAVLASLTWRASQMSLLTWNRRPWRQTWSPVYKKLMNPPQVLEVLLLQLLYHSHLHISLQLSVNTRDM